MMIAFPKKAFTQIFTKIAAISLMLLASNAAQSQTVSDYSAMMQRFSQVEHDLLSQRTAWMAEESAMAQPFWVRDENGGYHIEDTAAVRRQIEQVVFFAQTLGVDDAAIAHLPYWKQISLNAIGKDVTAAIAVEQVMVRLAAISNQTRREALVAHGRAVEQAQVDFAFALAQRDTALSGQQSQQANSDVSICATNPPEGAVRYTWRTTGMGTDYWDAGGFYCEAYAGAYVRLTTERLVYYTCSDRELTSCTKNDTVYLMDLEEGFDINSVTGFAYKNEATLNADNYQSTFS